MGKLVGIHLSEDVVCDVEERVIRGATSARAATLCEEDVVEHLFRLLQLLADVHIVVHAEHLRLLQLRQILAKQTQNINYLLAFSFIHKYSDYNT